MPAQPLVVATRNQGKTVEFGRLLGPDFATELLPRNVTLPPEEGITFRTNAVAKAGAAYEAMGRKAWVLADDSGLEVTALDGRPGVMSARYAGVDATDGENLRLLLEEMDGCQERSAHFVCSLALMRSAVSGEEDAVGRDAAIIVVEGYLEGVLETEPRGDGGFGYDPVFRPAGWSKTLAEASASEKDAVSHRGAAVRALRAKLGAEEEDR